jgi:hypothetical protein
MPYYTHPASPRGAHARSSRCVGWGCGGRVGSQRDLVMPTNDLDADVKSCGPGLPVLRSAITRKRCRTRGQSSRSPGRARISVKTSARGMPVDRLNLWYLPPAFFSAGGPWVRPSPGIPCALSLFEGRVYRTIRADRAAGMRSHARCCLGC